MRRILSGIPAALAGAGGVAAMLGGCFFNAELPLENDPPVCSNHSSIVRSLVYPDSSVCTLEVDDGNDTVLDVWTASCTAAIDSLRCDSDSLGPWPGGVAFIERGYGVKKLILSLDTGRMGRYSGKLILIDAAAATVALPYTIDKMFADPFDTYPPDKDWWHMYATDDSSHIQPDRVDGKLVFSFEKSAGSLAMPIATGIRTKFSLTSDFYTTVDFKLRDEMDDAFEVAFFVSTSPDTGRWAGEKAGIFITGSSGRLRFECRSVNLQSYSYESGATAGELGIRRADSTLSCFFHDGNPAYTPKPLTSQIFPKDVPVYVHLKMSVRDQSKTRNCYWNDFTVPEGLIRFLEE